MGKTLRDLMRDYERSILVSTLKQNGGDRILTAKALGITTRWLEKVLLRHHLAVRRYTKQLPMPTRTEVQEDRRSVAQEGEKEDA